MKAYFEDGSSVTTDNSPLFTHDQIDSNLHQLDALSNQIKRLSRYGAKKGERKMAQAMKCDFDTLLAKTKLLIKKHEKESRAPLREQTHQREEVNVQ